VTVAGDRPRRTSGGAATSRNAVHELVYRELRRSLMTGTFVPGKKVSLRSLAEQVNTSLTPVRGAVNRLIAEGAFQMLPNRWVAVPLMTRKRFDEIVYWRVQLETEATRQACGHVNKRLINKLESINRRIVKSVQAGNRYGLLSMNYDFHFAIYRASQSSILLPMIESLWLQAGPFAYYSLTSPRELWNAKCHDAIILALAAGDTDAALRAIRQDITNTADFLRENGHYEEPRLRQVTR